MDSDLRMLLALLLAEFSEYSEEEEQKAREWASEGHMDNAQINMVRAITYTHCANRLRAVLAPPEVNRGDA